MIPLLELSQQHKYEHYLLIEYDVALVGSFRKFVMTVDSQYDADYIHIATDMSITIFSTREFKHTRVPGNLRLVLGIITEFSIT